MFFNNVFKCYENASKYNVIYNILSCTGGWTEIFEELTQQKRDEKNKKTYTSTNMSPMTNDIFLEIAVLPTLHIRPNLYHNTTKYLERLALV